MSTAFLFVLVCAASYRVWRFVALDSLPPLVAVRDRIDAAITRRHGTPWADGLACVWCSGFWACAIVVGIVWALRPLPLPGLWFLAVSTVVGLVGMTLDD